MKSCRKLYWQNNFKLKLDLIYIYKTPKPYINEIPNWQKNICTVKAFSITISSLQISWPLSHLLKVHKPPKRASYLSQEQYKVLWQYILLNCSLCPSRYPHQFWLLMAFCQLLLVSLPRCSLNFSRTCWGLRSYKLSFFSSDKIFQTT